MELKEQYVKMLQTELKNRKEVNPSYSLRAFARDLQIPAPHLSMVLSFKKGLSKLKAQSIAQRLSWASEEKDLFISLVEACHTRSKQSKNKAYDRIQDKLKKDQKLFEKIIEDDEFVQIADPIHFQILEALKISFIENNLTGLNNILPHSEKDILEACNRLCSLGYLNENKGEYSVGEFRITTSDKKVSQALRSHHTAQLKAGLEAIYQQDINARCLSSLTVAVSEEQIPLVFEKVKKFRKEINQFLSEDKLEEKTKVYSLNTQFFRVSKEIK